MVRLTETFNPMDTSIDIRELPRPMLIGIGIAILFAMVLLFFLVDRFVYPILPRPPMIVEKLQPPPGYPDIPPYNTKVWQEGFKKRSGQATGAPPGPPAR